LKIYEKTERQAQSLPPHFFNLVQGFLELRRSDADSAGRINVDGLRLWEALFRGDDQLGGTKFEGTGEVYQALQGEVAGSTLDIADVGAMKSCAVGNFLLGEAEVFAALANGGGQC
jgi:hypothetical protein